MNQILGWAVIPSSLVEFFFLSVTAATYPDCLFLQDHSAKVMKLFEDIFGWLPLATVVNKKILVTHGGISNITDLSIIEKIDRHKVSMTCETTQSG